jgi:hypothetical protein
MYKNTRTRYYTLKMHSAIHVYIPAREFWFLQQSIDDKSKFCWDKLDFFWKKWTPCPFLLSNQLLLFTGCIKKQEFERFFHIFLTRKFFSKMTLLGLILCGEWIPEAWKRFPDPDSVNRGCIEAMTNFCYNT